MLIFCMFSIYVGGKSDLYPNQMTQGLPTHIKDMVSLDASSFFSRFEKHIEVRGIKIALSILSLIAYLFHPPFIRLKS